MADIEIKYRFGLIEAVKWWLMRHNSVELQWPSDGEIEVDHNDAAWVDLGGAVTISAYTNCPNWHYRPYLDRNVGQYGKDWMWKGHAPIPVVLCDGEYDKGSLELRVSNKKAKWLSLIQLKWATK